MSLKELQLKSEKLKLKLGSMMEENVSLKYKLSEVLKEKFDKKMLMAVEEYQNYFVKEDELIVLLRNDIAVLDKLMKSLGEGKEITVMDKKLEQLRNNILLVESQFYKLKSEFTDYLIKNKLSWQ